MSESSTDPIGLAAGEPGGDALASAGLNVADLNSDHLDSNDMVADDLDSDDLDSDDLDSDDLDADDLVDMLAERLARRRSLVPGPDADCGLDADCPPDQICLDGHCT